MSCKATITYTWTCADCEGNNHDWVYTYTIEGDSPSPAGDGLDGGLCGPALAPTPPVVTDNCGDDHRPGPPWAGPM